MSKSDKTASAEGQDERPSDFVLDILYQDARRVGSFLSQFDDAGLLQQVIERESVTKGRRRGFKFNVGGGATWLGTGGSGTVGVERGPGEQGSEGSDRIYDPFWTNTLTLLDFLAAAELIQPTLDQARIGQFVKLSGRLEVRNLTILRAAWEEPTLMRLLQGEGQEAQAGELNRQQRRAMGIKKAPKEITQSDIGIALMKIMPHSLQATITSDVGVWCNLLEEGLTNSVDDFLLKHGVSVAGEWSAVGILDALPDTIESDVDHDFSWEKGGLVGTLMSAIAPAGRLMLGRPPSFFGMTPLVIYREVTG